MPDRERRQKASDVFANTDFVFGTKTTDFHAAFPEIDTVSVTVTEEGEGIREWSHVRHYDEKRLGEYIDCSNPLCYNGGLRIGQLIRNMGYSKATQLRDEFGCQGYEGTPKGRKNYGPCFNRFGVKIEVKYRDSE